ncbi:hypothetical protein [Rathayibacter tritici]|uniref:hypothetical protein n=1 Tax=Rathayibacter tritici TaxID=33888 RepID=UPI0011B02720|nr:hypothetical protein [Rathayibacter tritici]
MPKKTRDVIVASSDWTVPTADGVHRRTIVKGAAWTVPVVAVSMATPAAAASKTPTLKFTQGSYTGTACKTITGVQVKRTTDGTTADPGKTVTVTLKDGYTFADGTTTYTGTTDADGLVTLPDIKVPSKGGNSNFSATSNTLSASAPVSSTATAKTGVYTTNQANSTASTDPYKDSSTAIKVLSTNGAAAFIYQNSDGSIHDSTGAVIDNTATGVKTGAGLVSTSSESYFYMKSDGIYSYNYSTAVTTGPIKDSATMTDSSKAIKLISSNGGSAFIYQDSDGSLHDSTGKVIPGTSTGVDTGANLVSISSTSYYYKKSDGVYAYNYKTRTTTGPIADSKDATKLISTNGGEAFVFQSSDGSLRTSDGKIVTGTEKGVDTGDNLVSLSNDSYYYKKADGIYRYNYSTATTTGPIANSTNATKLVSSNGGGAFVFQNPDGTIRNSSGAVIKGTESGVDTGTDLVSLNSNSYFYKKSPACS